MNQKRSVTAAENGTSESGKRRLWQSFAYAYTKVWAGLGWAHEGLGWAGLGRAAGWAGLGWVGWHQKRGPRAYQDLPSKTRKRSGTAAPNEPKMNQKRSVTAAENGTSESGKRSLWQRFAYAYTKVWAGLGWAHEGLGWAEAGQTWPTWAYSARLWHAQLVPRIPQPNENGTSESGKKRLWQSFAYAYTKVWAGLGWAHKGLGWAEAGQTQLGLGRAAGWAPLGWAGWAGTKNEAPEPTLQNKETQRHGGPKRAKNGPKTERYGGREWHL